MLPDGMTAQQLFDETLAHYLAGGLPGARRGAAGWRSWYRTGVTESAGQPVGPGCVIGRQIPDDLYQEAVAAHPTEGIRIDLLLQEDHQLTRRFRNCPHSFLKDLQAAHDSVIAGFYPAGLEPAAWRRQFVSLLVLVGQRHQLVVPDSDQLAQQLAAPP